jgi:hypothetical protein
VQFRALVRRLWRARTKIQLSPEPKPERNAVFGFQFPKAFHHLRERFLRCYLYPGSAVKAEKAGAPDFFRFRARFGAI